MKNLSNWQYSNRLAAIVLFWIALFNSIFVSVIFLLGGSLNKNMFGIFLIAQFVFMFFYIERKIGEYEKKL
ncbi:hypothetical protein [Flavobacterium ginsenosidimutans]|nr:hypothetical protein DM444_19850 [Flavobacterium ginsenosidimutans]